MTDWKARRCRILTPDSLRRPAAPGTPEYQRALDEYLEVSVNFRHHADVRFRQLGLFAAITGALLTGYVHLPEVTKAFIAFLGIISTILFFHLEQRLTAYRLLYYERAQRLQEVLEFQQYWPLGSFWTVIRTLAILFSVLLLFWVGAFNVSFGALVWRRIGL